MHARPCVPCYSSSLKCHPRSVCVCVCVSRVVCVTHCILPRGTPARNVTASDSMCNGLLALLACLPLAASLHLHSPSTAQQRPSALCTRRAVVGRAAASAASAAVVAGAAVAAAAPPESTPPLRESTSTASEGSAWDNVVKGYKKYVASPGVMLERDGPFMITSICAWDSNRGLLPMCSSRFDRCRKSLCGQTP